MELWDELKLQDNQAFSWKLAELRLDILKDKNKLHYAVSTSDEEEQSPSWHGFQKAEYDPDLNWKRCIINEKDYLVRILPSMPTRPIVVRPETPLIVLPGSSARFFVSIPVWYSFLVGKDQIAWEIPSLALSNTWFGDPLSGVFCYALRSSAKTEYTLDKLRKNIASCSILVENNSLANFEFNRLCIHTEFLNIYQSRNTLWTNEIKVILEGENQRSSFEIIETAPKFEKNMKLLQTRREEPSKHLTKKMFSDFKFMKG